MVCFVCLLFVLNVRKVRRSVTGLLTRTLSKQTNKQTDQTTTLCVQEVEIYLERWEVLGALVDVSVDR